MHARIDVARDAADRRVRLPPQRALVVVERQAGRRRRAGQRRRQVIDDAPDAAEEPERAFEAGVGPLDFLLRRRDEHHVQPQRVGAELADHVVRIDDVALRLGHDGAVLQHHALRQQPVNGSSIDTSPTSRNTRLKKRE